MAGFGYDPIDEFDTKVQTLGFFGAYQIKIQKIQLQAISTWIGSYTIIIVKIQSFKSVKCVQC